MWQIFGLEITRFSFLVLSALVIFGQFWLYFDAWKERKSARDIPLLIGLLALSFSFLAQSMSFETKVLVSVISNWNGEYLYLRVAAYILMIYGLILTPIEKRPNLNAFLGVGGVLSLIPVQFILPVLSASVAVLYWRRASIGLEAHMSKVAIAFSVLSLYELFSLSSLFRSTQNVWIFRLVAPFGVISIMQYCLLGISMIILARWTWYYLLKRLSTQLFMITLSGAVGLSLLITGLFVSLLLKNIESDSLQKLKINAQITASLMEEKKARLISETKLFSTNQELLKSIVDVQRKTTTSIARNHMTQAGLSSLIIIDSEGKIVLRAENEEEKGTSLSEDEMVNRALKGEVVSGFTSTANIISPEVQIRAVVPIENGAIIASQSLNNIYLDSIKKTSGMSISVYGQKVLSATTEDIGDGETRLIGLRETNRSVLDAVWKKGHIYSQLTQLGDNAYLSGYVPLKDSANIPVAVLQVGQPQANTLQTAGQAVQMTFVLVISIIIMFSFPIYLVCERLVAEWE